MKSRVRAVVEAVRAGVEVAEDTEDAEDVEEAEARLMEDEER